MRAKFPFLHNILDTLWICAVVGLVTFLCLCLAIVFGSPLTLFRPLSPFKSNFLCHCQIVLGEERLKCSAVSESEAWCCCFQFNTSILNSLEYSKFIGLGFNPAMPKRLKRWTHRRIVSLLAIWYFLANWMELIPVKYCVTIEIRNSKLNLVIIKPPRLLSNLGGSLHIVAFLANSP